MSDVLEKIVIQRKLETLNVFLFWKRKIYRALKFLKYFNDFFIFHLSAMQCTKSKKIRKCIIYFLGKFFLYLDLSILNFWALKFCVDFKKWIKKEVNKEFIKLKEYKNCW